MSFIIAAFHDGTRPRLVHVDDASSLQIVTLIVAILGLVLAVISLGWQIISWSFEGPKVRVTTSFGMLVYGSELSDQHVIVEAANVGRSPVELTSWGFHLGHGKSTFMQVPIPGSTPLPTTIAGGHHARWFIELAELRRGVTQARTGIAPRAFVNLATGRKIFSKPLSLASG